jgi:large subunit ribosomal protein L18Ae
MYKEYREMSRCAAVVACYQDMAARHRARFRSVQVIRVAEISNADVHRIIRAQKGNRALFSAKRPSTYY